MVVGWFSSARIPRKLISVRLANEIDTSYRADGADVQHVRQPFKAHAVFARIGSIFSRARSGLRPGKDRCGETSGAGQRMRRIGVAVGLFDAVLRAFHESVVDPCA